MKRDGSIIITDLPKELTETYKDLLVIIIGPHREGSAVHTKSFHFVSHWSDVIFSISPSDRRKNFWIHYYYLYIYWSLISNYTIHLKIQKKNINLLCWPVYINFLSLITPIRMRQWNSMPHTRTRAFTYLHWRRKIYICFLLFFNIIYVISISIDHFSYTFFCKRPIFTFTGFSHL